MSETNNKKYSADPHIAEIYDQHETQTNDTELILRLIGSRTELSIFEPFSGTGRMAIPLARSGHNVIALDESQGMLDRLKLRLSQEPPEVPGCVEIITSPVFATDWPVQQDVVILGGNCLHEVNSSDEQRALIHRAAASLREGGYVFIDNDDHQSAELLPSWQKPIGQVRKAFFPNGTCQDGTSLETTNETLWFDINGRFVHYKRRLKVTHVDGNVSQHQWLETCHPVVMDEVLEWVGEAGFEVEKTFGDKNGNPYSSQSPRCLVWARKK